MFNKEKKLLYVHVSSITKIIRDFHVDCEFILVLVLCSPEKTHTEHIFYNTLEDIKNQKIKVINRDVLFAHY